ncbi:hypothetical protein C2E23DRAFT_872393 [Lenzites betulinus]|nr:hypothetical protein C2E23DRAFT_872393 [Lenzites betulinus]
MKHLRRNRSTSVSTPSASTSAPPAVSAPTALSPAAAARAAAERTRPSHETPLYARFAGTRRGQEVSKPAGQGPVPVPFPQQKSSDSRKERERRRDGEQVEKRVEERRRDEGDEETRPTHDREESKDVRPAEDRTTERKDNDGTALSATGSPSTTAATPGRHGTRVDGARVTQKRVVAPDPPPAQDEGNAVRVEEKRAERSADPAPIPSGRSRAAGERVLLPARKVASRRTEDAQDPRSSPAPDSTRRDATGPASTTAPAPELSKASTSTSTAGSSSSARAHVSQKPGTGARPTEHARAGSSTAVAFPEEASLAGSGVSARAALVASGEDQFSTPKRTRIRVHTLATATARPAAPVDRDQEDLKAAWRSRPVPEDSTSGSSRATATVNAEETRVSQTHAQESESRSSIHRKQPRDGSPRRAPEPLRVDPPAANSHPAPESSGSSGGAEPMASTSTSSQVTPKPAVPVQTPQPSKSSDAPPRRRKYSLRAAFGLPDPEVSASAGASGSVSVKANANVAKPPPVVLSPPPPHPPPPPPSPAPPPDRTHTPASPPDPPEVHVNEPNSEPSSQLHSLHLSGFNFPLDALLGTLPAPPPRAAPHPARATRPRGEAQTRLRDCENTAAGNPDRGD